MENEPKTRSDLAKMVPSGGMIIELGVAAGRFAVEMIDANPSCQYLGIDRWSDHHDELEMVNATDRIKRASSLSQIIRDSFDSAIRYFDDESIDLLYVDGYAHTGQEGGKTLNDWLSKVKTGGIISGHDYHPEYQPTIDAVNTFVKAHGLDLQIIDENPYPSWYCIKK